MPVNYSQSAENARLQAVVSLIDAQSNPGVLRLLDANGLVLSSLTLASPSATVASGVITFYGMPLTDPAAARSGTAVAARIEDGVGNIVISGLTVSAVGGADILLTPTTSISAGQAVSLQSGTITGN